MNEVSLKCKVAVDSDHDIAASPENLPGFGISWFWLLLFFGLYLVGLVLYFFGYGIVVGVQHAQLAGTAELESVAQELIEKHAMSAEGMSGSYITMFFILMPAIYLASNFKNQPWRDTLCIKAFRPTSLYLWLGVLVVFFIAQVATLTLIETPLTDFTETVANSKSILLAVVMIFFAPVVEELVFRGYLFKAWRYTRMGLYGTLTLTSLFFIALHYGQYHWSTMLFLFILSFILGLSREKTGSVLVPIILHSVNNILAITLAYLSL